MPSPRRLSRTPAAPASKDPTPVVARPTWWPTTSAPSLSLTSRIRSAMSASGALSTAASSARPGLYDDPLGVADHLHPRLREPGCERLGGGEGGIGGPVEPVLLATAVDHQRRDRADDVVGDVVAAPGRVVGRTGEEAVVEPDPHPAAPAEGLRGGEGQRGDVDTRRIEAGRLVGRGRPAGEVGVSPADEDDLARRRTADDAGGEAVVGAEPVQGGTDGEELGDRGREEAAVAGRPDLRCRRSGRRRPRRRGGPGRGRRGRRPGRRRPGPGRSARVVSRGSSSGVGTAQSGRSSPAGGATASGSVTGSAASHGR